MNPAETMQQVIEGKRYRVETATLLADDAYWDGSNHERNGRNRFLYRTPRGRYFTVTLTMWQGERDYLTPVDVVDARELYETALMEHHVEYEEAFPDVAIEDA